MVKVKKRILKKRYGSGLKDSDNQEIEEMDRGQVWSIDVLLAVVIFVSVILIFYVTMVPRQKPQMKDLEIESGALKLELEKNNEFGFITNDEVNSTKFQAFIDNATANYTDLKKKLGVKGEFCLFYEDSDGNVVPISLNDTMQLIGVGNSSIKVAGFNCGSQIS
jgi:hypothetical protein